MFFFSKKKKKNTTATAKGVLCHEQYNIYTWTVKKKKITIHICMFIYMHRRMGTICFLSKSQNIFFFFAFGSKVVFAQKKKRKILVTTGGVLCHEKYNIYT